MSEQPPRHASPPTAPRDAERRPASSRPRRRRTTVAPRTVESYLRANSAPRYMRRLTELETEFQAQQRRLEAAYLALVDALGNEPECFGRRWRAQAAAWRFDRLNDLVREHNAWYPAEANLPMDPRTCDYRAVRGASYRRLELDPSWILERYPPVPPGAAQLPPRLTRAPREPLPASARAVRRAAG